MFRKIFGFNDNWLIRNRSYKKNSENIYIFRIVSYSDYTTAYIFAWITFLPYLSLIHQLHWYLNTHNLANILGDEGSHMFPSTCLKRKFCSEHAIVYKHNRLFWTQLAWYEMCVIRMNINEWECVKEKKKRFSLFISLTYIFYPYLNSFLLKIVFSSYQMITLAVTMQKIVYKLIEDSMFYTQIQSNV